MVGAEVAVGDLVVQDVPDGDGESLCVTATGARLPPRRAGDAAAEHRRAAEAATTTTTEPSASLTGAAEATDGPLGRERSRSARTRPGHRPWRPSAPPRRAAAGPRSDPCCPVPSESLESSRRSGRRPASGAGHRTCSRAEPPPLLRAWAMARSMPARAAADRVSKVAPGCWGSPRRRCRGGRPHAVGRTRPEPSGAW